MSNDMYFSVDVETDGPVPGLHSMLSIGVVALDPETLEEVDTYYATLEPLPEAKQDLSTMKWWAGFPQQYTDATRDPSSPETAMLGLDAWVRLMTESKDGQKLSTPVFVAYPASFDFMFYAYYAHRFVGESVFGFAALDMGSLAMGLKDGSFSSQSKKKWPETWVAPEDLTAIHHALDDARQQANIFRKMMRTPW